MRIWIDCEWADFRGELISMALVTDSGQEFYTEAEFEPRKCNQWVIDNVTPHLHGNPLPPRLLTAKLGVFLDALRADAVELIADWPEDIERFCHALITGPGQRIKTPAMRFRIIDGDGAVSEVPHHALHDARALRALHLQKEAMNGTG